ncbi:MAG: potassium channel family protein [Spirochaetota bacterium]
MSRRQYAIIGVSKFGLYMLDELSKVECEILVIDKKKELIETLKDRVTSSYIADAINEETIRRLVPKTIDAAIIDLGDRVEVSILVTNYVKKLGVKTIVARAESKEHGEILELIGATHVVFPNQEAAKRVAPIILSKGLFAYFPLSDDLVIAEVEIPKEFAGKTLIESDLRNKAGVTIIALKRDDGYHQFVNREYRLDEGEVVLISCSPNNLSTFTGIALTEEQKKKPANKRVNLFG